MKQRLTMALYQYWLGIRSSLTTPNVRNIEHAAMRDILPYVFILEGATLETLTLNFSGAMMNRIYSFDQSGTSFFDLWNEWDRDDVRNTLHTVSALKLPTLIGAAAVSDNERASYFEVLLLPFRKNVNILGSIVQVDEARWIKAPLGPLHVISTRILHAELEMPSRRFGKKPSPQAGRPTLIVYDGLKRK
ncbi:PAS domain-containing protein [Rhodoblastus sp.]|uniref:PAS domain-containing protein n=1 Tax=Rhodoblastus sp. TaxID=1962975 RepID=UPI003F9EAB30